MGSSAEKNLQVVSDYVEQVRRQDAQASGDNARIEGAKLVRSDDRGSFEACLSPGRMR